ncbi:hypothetical protein GCM10022254_19020 [Actinomadura meridiana]|uniref:Uncharacterized protein n=1 Tax=Actinomadura meridiana TaxID=559626 RepID=A0ABP8BWH8_9ACTN
MGTTLIRTPIQNPDAMGRAVRADLPGVPVITLKVLPLCLGEMRRRG